MLRIQKHHKEKSGLAIPLVLLFCFCALIMATAMFYFRKESKQQAKTNIQFIQANFLAQSAIQHILAKLSVLPQEASDAGLVSFGKCPLQSIISGAGSISPGPNKDDKGLKTFYSDCNTTTVPWQITGVPDFNINDWKYHIEDFKIISAYTKKDGTKLLLVLTAQITAIGEMNEKRGNKGLRKEKMVKTIKLTRVIGN